MRTLRILIAEDNGAFRKALRTLLETQPGWQVIAEAVNGRDVVMKAKEFRPDLIILDYMMPELDGLSAAAQIRQSAPNVELLLLTQHDAPFTVLRALDAGVRGYVVKSDACQDLLKAIEAVRQHKTFISPTISNTFPGKLTKHNIRSDTARD